MTTRGLALTSTKRFKTGSPITFTYLHNNERAPKRVKGSVDSFQQGIEPAGFYCLEDEIGGSLPKSWVRGEITFQAPIVLRDNTGSGRIYDENSWKVRLSQHYGGKKGLALSRAILRDGFDGIVTVDSRGATSEIVDLTRVRS